MRDLTPEEILDGKVAILQTWLARPELIDPVYIAQLNQRISRLRERVRVRLEKNGGFSSPWEVANA